MHTEHDEKIQDLFADYTSFEVIALDENERAALETDSKYAVIAEDDYSQSMWVVDNIIYFSTRKTAQQYCDAYNNDESGEDSE